MEDPQFKLEMPVVKPEKNMIVNHQINADTSYPYIEALNRNASETDSPEDVEKIKDTNISKLQKYSSLVSTTDEIHLGDNLNSFHMDMKSLSLESRGVIENNNNRITDDEREDVNSRRTECKGFVDNQTKLSSSRINEFNNQTRESSELDAKVIENIVEDNQRSKCTSSLIKRKSPIPSINSDKNLKEVTDECSCINSKKKSANPKSKQVQPLKQESSEIKRQDAMQYIEVIFHEKFFANVRSLKIEKRNSKASFKFPHAAHKEDAMHASQQQELAVLEHDKNQIAFQSQEKSVDQTHGKAIQLNEEILQLRFQDNEMQCSPSHSKSKNKAGRCQFGKGRGVCSKYQAFPTKIKTVKVEKKECLNKSRCEHECLNEILLKSVNLAPVHEESVPANAPRLLESYLTNTGLTDIPTAEDKSMLEVNVPLGDKVDSVSECVKAIMSREFTTIVVKLTSDSVDTEHKCIKFIDHLNDILDKDIGVNREKLLRNEIMVFKSINQKLADIRVEINKFKRMIDEVRSEKLALSPDLKDFVRENLECLYMGNITLHAYFETIVEKLGLIDEGILIKGSKENRLKTLIAEFVKEIEGIKMSTFETRDMIEILDKRFY